MSEPPPLGDDLVQAIETMRWAESELFRLLLDRVQATAAAMLAGPYERLSAQIADLERRIANLEATEHDNDAG